jgi:hypothetical protein
VLHLRATKIQNPMGQTSGLREVLIIELKGRRHRWVENLELGGEDFHSPARKVLVNRSLGPTPHPTLNTNTKLVTKRFRCGEHIGPIRITDHLSDALSVTQIDKDDPAMIPPAMHPAAEGNGLIEYLGGEAA